MASFDIWALKCIKDKTPPFDVDFIRIQDLINQAPKEFNMKKAGAQRLSVFMQRNDFMFAGLVRIDGFLHRFWCIRPAKYNDEIDVVFIYREYTNSKKERNRIQKLGGYGQRIWKRPEFAAWVRSEIHKIYNGKIGLHL